MKVNSLAFRLFLTAAIWTAIALPIVGYIFHTQITERIIEDFNGRLRVLARVIQSEATGEGNEPLRPASVVEPLFEVTNSGWYWQIKPVGGKPGRLLVSDSLATARLPSPYEKSLAPDINDIRWLDTTGPLGQPLRIAEIVERLGDETDGRLYAFTVAGPLDWARADIARRSGLLATVLACMGLGLLVATLFQVRFGLAPLTAIEKGLARIRSGEAERLDGDLPAEIKPLQVELNALMKSNEDIIERARTQVGNLAHALKTPLAVLTNEADDTKTPLAGKVIEQTSIMRDQVSHYLDRARVAASATTIGRITPVAPIANAIKRALERIHRDKGIEIHVACSDAMKFRGEKHDLEELLGNLLDNASKWARKRIRLEVRSANDVQRPHIAAPQEGSWLYATIEDDGDGVPKNEREKLVRRGVRLDETTPGSGLGMSIVNDLVASYRGYLELGESDMGGLKVSLVLPAAE